MKCCIVNADDFGMSRGINRGIIEAHVQGVVTSTSLMVNMPYSEHAAALSREVPHLSVGLHVNFTGEGGPPIVDLTDPAACSAELHRQFQQFQMLMGCLPTHLDSHHNIHRYPRLFSSFLDLAQQYALPLRGCHGARYFPSFYGQWDEETHPEQISVENLTHMLRAEIGDGITEISCHPGYVDPDFHSIYFLEREMELRTLCNPLVRETLQDLNIQLISFRDLKQFRDTNHVSGRAPWLS